MITLKFKYLDSLEVEKGSLDEGENGEVDSLEHLEAVL